MTQKIEDELKSLSIQYKEAYAIKTEIETGIDEIKDKIKDLAKDNYANDIIKVSHITTATPQYKEMIIDSGIEIPEKYIKHGTQVRITINKKKD